MYWKDEGYLLSKNNFSENSIIIEAFTAEHGKIFWYSLWWFFKKTKKKKFKLVIKFFKFSI